MRTPAEPAEPLTRVDLHVHSRASTDTGSWFLNRAVLPESYVDPHELYATCRRRGMDLVALTDHNTISGAMEIAHHPDVIVGAEITATFPEDGVQLHVLAWGVDDAAWADLDRARGNLYELVPVLRAAGIPYALAHPLHRVAGDLTVGHLEKCLLLFPLWEGRNGYRPRLSNEVGERIAATASPALLERLAEKHGIAPVGSGPPGLTGGSDDHSLLEVAATWTQTPYAPTPAHLLDHLRAGRVTPGGAHGSSAALAHSVGTLLLKRYAMDGAAGIPEPLRGPFADVIHHPLGPAPTPPRGVAADGPGGLATGFMERARRDRSVRREFRRLGRAEDGPQRSRARLRLVTGWLHREALAMALDPTDLTLGSLSRRFDGLLTASAVAAPYCLSARWMRDEREHAVRFEREYFGAPGVMRDGPTRAVVFTDTFDQLNGAAGTMRRLAAWSAAQPDPPVTVVAGGRRAGSGPGLLRIPPVVELPVPAYADPGWRLAVPSLLDVLEAIDATGARVVHAATPGPMGVMGLLAARALGLPFVSGHHTELGDYAMHLTGDRLAAGLTRRAVLWFHGQARRVYVPTRTAAERLVCEGVPRERVEVFGRGVDTETFAPGHRSWVARQRLGGRQGTVVLYVGRLSREKGLEVLADAFRMAVARRPDLRLALVGDGPFRGRLGRLLSGTPHRFMGALTGQPLSAAYASADMFCLPSATETFGQVVLEAAASGLPVVVTDTGGARESVEHGTTGLVVPAGNAEAMAQAILRLARDPSRRGLMGARARDAAARRHDWDRVFTDLVAGYAGVLADADAAAQPRDPLGATRTDRLEFA